MSTLHRVIDVNANRAREALRVIEDAARFHLNDEALTQSLKVLRHDLQAALRQLPAGILGANRDVDADVGTTISTQSELTRFSYADIVAAASSRLAESLRSLEEAAKVINAILAQHIEQIRYRFYSVQERINLQFAGGNARQWKLCILITESLCRRSWRDVVRESLAAGADCIQLREKSIDGGELKKRAVLTIDLASQFGASVIINDRADVALAAGAHGVHLGQTDLTVADVRKLCGLTLLVGVSTHDTREAAAAVEAGADYCGVGTMFPSTLKPEYRTSGVAFLQEFIHAHPTVPHLAIGGITPSNAAILVETGCRGMAASSCVCAAENPGEVVRQLLAAW